MPLHPLASSPFNRMRRTSLSLLGAILLTAATNANLLGQSRESRAADPESQPSSGIGSAIARVEAPVRDFGVLRPDSSLQADFPIENAGTMPLEILRIEPTYGCSIVGSPPKYIAPGESQTLSMKLDPATLRGFFDKQVMVQTNDPANPSFLLNMRGEMRRIIEVSPPAASFGKIEPNDLRERILTITNSSSDPLEITMDAPVEYSPFAAQLVETIKGREYKLFVNTRPPYRTGTIRSEIKLHTNNAAQTELIISAFAIIPPEYEVVPPAIPVPAVAADSNLELLSTVQVVQFNNFGEKPIRITGASSSDSSVKTAVFEVNTGKRYRITVELPPRYRPGQNEPVVTLMTDDPNKPSIEVPIGRQTGPSRVANAQASSQPTGSAATPKKMPALELIGKAAPPITLTTLEGAPVGNPEFEFHPATVLNFFAANCPFCKRQIPKVEALRAKYESLGVRFVNVCETMRTPFTPDQVQKVMNDLSANLEIAMDSGNRYGRSYQVTGFPVLFVVRQDGIIEHAVSGDKANLVEMVEEKLDALISQAASPKSAASATATTQPAG